MKNDLSFKIYLFSLMINIYLYLLFYISLMEWNKKIVLLIVVIRFGFIVRVGVGARVSVKVEVRRDNGEG